MGHELWVPALELWWWTCLIRRDLFSFLCVINFMIASLDEIIRRIEGQAKHDCTEVTKCMRHNAGSAVG